MKSKLIKICSLILAIMMLAGSFVACDSGAPAETTEPTPEATKPEATEPEETKGEQTKEETQEIETTAEETTAGVPAAAEGLLVYRQDFNLQNLNDTTEVLKQIGWTKLTKEGNGVFNETDCEFSIVDGRLYFDNYDATPVEGDTRVRGKDGYYAIDLLTQDYMKSVCAGKYTLQYDLEYSEAGATDRYAVIVTEGSADGQFYNSFHLRVQGRANHQCHFYDSGTWYTYNTMPATTDGSIPSLCEKLLGTAYDKDAYALLGKKITLKIQWDPAEGQTVYGKTAEMTDFVLLSEPDPDGQAYGYQTMGGCAVWFKLGAKIDGYLDNIVIWTGWGDMPTAATPDYKPAA